MKKMLTFLLFVGSACFGDYSLYQENIIWFSVDFKKLYIGVSLVPEEDSPFHYGYWGNERGSHIYEVDFSEMKREFKHSKTCKCEDYLTNKMP